MLLFSPSTVGLLRGAGCIHMMSACYFVAHASVLLSAVVASLTTNRDTPRKTALEGALSCEEGGRGRNEAAAIFFVLSSVNP